MRKPNFFVVGAPKCGTTAMSVYLKQHPEIFIPHAKEPHFFGSDLVSHQFHRYRDKEQYLSLFSAVRDEKRVGEASVWYLYSKQAAAEIKEFNSQAKIIIMLRDPVEMIYSMHSQSLYSYNEDIVNFEAALDAEEDRKKGLRIPERAWFVQALFYREIAKYTEQVKRYLNAFGWENVHIIIFDDFESDTAEVYRDTLRFLDVNPNFQTEFYVVNPNKRVWSEALLAFTKNPPPVARRLVRGLMPYQTRDRLLKSLRKHNTRYGPRKPVEAELSKRLREEFASEVEQLSELLGRDLTHWSRR